MLPPLTVDNTVVTLLPLPMTEVDDILLDLRTGSFKISQHAAEQMIVRNVLKADIEAIGWNCTSHRPQKHHRWLINGRDLDGEGLSVVVEYNDSSLVVTVMESRE